MVTGKDEQVKSMSGIPLKEIYTPDDVEGIDYERDLGYPGEPPYTRGTYKSMYRGQLWTIRQHGGYNTAEDTNKLFLEQYKLGETGFSIAGDISTPVGMDPDDPRVSADLGHAGTPIYGYEDMERVFKGIQIEKISTYLSDRVGGILTPSYFVMAERRGVDVRKVRGTTPNTILTWSSLNLANQVTPKGYLRLAVDTVEWCAEHAPNWHPVSLNSYNPRDNAITAVQELGLLMAEAILYLEEGKRRGRVPLDKLTKRFTFNMAVNNDFFEEIAKLRAARRMYSKIVIDRFGIKDPSCSQFRVHVQSSGSTATYREPLNNLIRIAYQVLGGVLGGAQSIHANGYDEAVCLPTEQSRLLSIRTEQILALETNVSNVVDPLGGSYYVEWLTNKLEEAAWQYVKEIEDMGGLLAAIESGWIHKEYKAAMLEHAHKLASGDITVVGVNKFRLEKVPYKVPIFRFDPKSGDILIERVKKLRRERDSKKVAEAIKNLDKAMRSDENTFPALLEAVRAQATCGEISNVGLDYYGVYRYPMSA